jgi:hypothetical protein
MGMLLWNLVYMPPDEEVLFMEAFGINVGYLVLQMICLIIIPLLLIVGLVVYLAKRNQANKED